MFLLVLGMLAAAPVSSPAAAPDAGQYPSEEALRHYLSGRVLEERGAGADAIGEYFRALALDDRGASIDRRVSAVAAGRGDLERSLEFADRALKLDPRDGEALWLKGTTLLTLGRDAEGRQALEAAVDADSNRAEFVRTLGRAADQMDDLPLAARCYRRAIWLDDSDGETWFQLATAEARLGRFGAADTALDNAAELNPVRPGLLFMRGLVDEHLGRLDEARTSYRHHLEVHPDDLAAHRQLLGVLARLKLWKEALTEARVLTRAQPDELEFQRWHADMAFEAGAPSEGVAVLDRLSHARPEDPIVLALRVGVLMRHGRARDAARDVNTALARQPGDLRLLILASRAEQAAGQPDSALAHLRRARTMAPDSLEPRVLLARLHQAQKHDHDAETELVDATRLFPQVNGLFFDLATLRERMGDLPGAESAVRDVLARQPDDPTALNFLGYLWADHDRNLDEAVRFIQRALTQDPDNGAFLDSLGWAYYRLGRLEDARGLLERALILSGGDPVIHEHLGDVYKALNLKDLARDQYRLSLADGHEDPRVRAKLDHLR